MHRSPFPLPIVLKGHSTKLSRNKACLNDSSHVTSKSLKRSAAFVQSVIESP